MTLVERLRRAHDRRTARAVGRDAALGLPVDGPKASRLGLPGTQCPSCEVQAHVDLLDIPGGRSHLRCTDCGHAWELDHTVRSFRGRALPER